ncbi:hypothetical protein [Micromonospora sp. KC723]|uniref:hypothetical protein n=1 Tax=Micromonospora sp. KC723 TaxID=2530381 RepID=UPI00104EC22F|nr:hypothetical protein [Micromonospora sp. KC723]TDB70926.1 hypothetical protein E1165_24360 [Micromonospora sp. KC723]
MRRAVSSVTVALGLLGATVTWCPVAAAAPAASAPAPKKRCTVEDPRLDELSGLVATRTGYIVINDGSLEENRKRVFYLDTKCKIAKEPVRYSGAGPFDTEDLAVSPDGRTLWIGDIGDNPGKERRSRIAVWTMPIGGGKQPVLHRLSYPEQKPHDAEALLVGADNLPLVITKVPSGKAEIYTPTGPLKSGDTAPAPMKKVGEIALPQTNTDNPLNIFGRVAITGAARSPDGTKVVLRTYADAFEYDVTGGDIVGALTTGKPKVTALADPFGEAISYSPDGKTFLTVSDAGELAADDPIDILAYTPSTTGAEALTGPADTKESAAEKSWFDSLTLDQMTYLFGGVAGVLGVLLVGAGIFGILRSRRRPAPADDGAERDGGAKRDDPLSSAAIDRSPRAEGGGRAASGGVYGGAPAGGGVYGAAAAGAAARPVKGGAVYGGAARPADAASARPAETGAPAARPPAVGGRPGGGAYSGGRPAGGAVYGGAPGGPHPEGGTRRGGAPAGPPAGVPRGGAPAGPPGGVRRAGAPRGGVPPAGGPAGPPAGVPRGGAPAGPPGGVPRAGAPRGGVPPAGGPAGPRGGAPAGGGVYGGRAQPPRREPGPREPRTGPRRDAGQDEPLDGRYGQPPGREHRGERY